MRKQLQKIKDKADNLVRPRGFDRDAELRKVEERVDRFKKILRTLEKKILPSFAIGLANDANAKKSRCQKIYEFSLGTTMEDLVKDLPDPPCALKTVLDNCGQFQKKLAEEKINNECWVEEDVYKKLSRIAEHIATIQKQKSVENKCASDYEQAKSKYANAKKAQETSNATKIAEHAAKIEQYKDEMDECEARLDKERDIYACNMYDLLAEEDAIVECLVQYVTLQEIYFRTSMTHANNALQDMKQVRVHKKVFGVPIEEHLRAKQPESDISFVIELCVCFLLERGFQEEGLFRVGHAAHKLSRLKSAIDAGIVNSENLPEINDPHVIAALLKNYLRSLPDPLLTYGLYKDFISTASLTNENGLKQEILRVLQKLPKPNYDNLRYLIGFLSEFKEQISKTRMSTQNIAIVISPNLLWAENEKDQGYSEQVSSTAAVNSIVEQLVGDYSYFFGEPVIFYQTLKKPVCKANRMSGSAEHTDDNGGFVSDGERNEPYTVALMTQSMGPTINTPRMRTPHGSDGTSQIILQPSNIPRTGSNNSMSDSSSPPQRSPRPARRKHNKAPAPHPALDKHDSETQTKCVVRTASDTTPSKPGIIRTTSTEEIRRHVDDNNGSHPQYSYNTISRYSVRGIEKMNKPSPLPRITTQKHGDAKIYENTDQTVTIREKPAIPERPANLPVRPNSISRPLTEFFRPELSPPINSEPKKQEEHTNNESQTQLERIQTFNIDKQQVAIIDIVGNNGKSHNKKLPNKIQMHTSQSESKDEKNQATESNNNSNYEYSLQQVPKSPRDNKIKRPQVPAPPPPTTTTTTAMTSSTSNVPGLKQKQDTEQQPHDSTNL